MLIGTGAEWESEESWFDYQQQKEAYIFFTVSKPALGPTKRPIQWSGRTGGEGGRPVREADHSTHLMPRLQISGALLPLLHVPSWHVQEQLRYCCCKSYGDDASYSLLQTSRNTFRTDILGQSHSGVDTSCMCKPVVKSETREELNIR